MIEERITLVEEILGEYRNELGDDYPGYKNHVYRMIHFCFALSDFNDEEREKILITACFHDLGIWTDNTFDYLLPSMALAAEYLQKKRLAEWIPEIELMIDQHHRLRKFRNVSYPLVEVFRKGDLVDFSSGIVKCGVPVEYVRAVKARFPNAGFHKRTFTTGRQMVLQSSVEPGPGSEVVSRFKFRWNSHRVIAISMINLWNRFSNTFRTSPGNYQPDHFETKSTQSASAGQCNHRVVNFAFPIFYMIMLFCGCKAGGKSVSPSISLISISTARLICEMGTSLALPSNGFSVLSPTCSSEVYTQEIKTLNGITNHTIFPFKNPVISIIEFIKFLQQGKWKKNAKQFYKECYL